MVLLAVGEWARYGRQTITYSADAEPRLEQLGRQGKARRRSASATTGPA